MSPNRPFAVVLFIVSILFTSHVSAQDEEKNWELNGYLKTLQTFNFISGFDSVLFDNLVHNRLNFKWYVHPNLTIYAEARNRLFYGDLVRAIPNYGDIIEDQGSFLNLSLNIIEGRSMILNTTLDRFYFEWIKDDWEVRLGKQRINWGVNLAWNPNDIFNAYSFFDFDYEERPGTDGIRIKKYYGFASSLELASNFVTDLDDWSIAGLWKWNKWNYDMQLLAGKAREDLVLGLGWAGNIKGAGFKGEATWFKPYSDVEENNFESLLLSMSWDYSFKNTLYIHGSFLVNTGIKGDTESFLLSNLNFEQLGVKELLPYQYSIFLQSSFSFSPLVSGSLSAMTFPGDRAIFINPALTISLEDNLDFDAIGQIFHSEENDEMGATARLLYFRLKWSF
ncbi:hypothetical protein QQ008_01540 [Fulvivirgaceae bacterium BMA10]|uniref:Alginate export domain-containing protein n=1 Tax=Splendidivirga corallicola TaxID=3051826 RepID=A0ABT8KJU0_9BACT|nr:hypothetical protein [Fulvivirgaceae bacterium BMA10]